MEKETAIRLFAEKAEEIVWQTLCVLSSEFAGDPTNKMFYIVEDEDSTDGVEVKCCNCSSNPGYDNEDFFFIHDYETPDPEGLGFDNLDEVDWAATGTILK